MRNRFWGIVLTALALAFPVTTASAALVTYSTAGSFNGGSNSIVFGGGGNQLTLTYTGVSSTVDANPLTFASLGSFQTTVTGSGAAITPGTNFALNITQTAPTGGSGALLATLTGTLSPNSSTGVATFSVNSATIGGVTYSVVNNPVVLVPPSTNNGITSVQGLIAIPEPAGLSLLGAAGLLALRRRR